jgi:HD-like signal output (HDOD) protein
MQNPEHGYQRGVEAEFDLAAHDLIGGELSKLWGLPDDVAQIVALHNQPVLDQDVPTQSVICALQLGHAVTMDIFPPQGITLSQDNPDIPDLLANLGISNKRYVEMHEWLSEKVEGIQFMATSA